MSSYPAVGGIPFTGAKAEFEWRIPNFYSSNILANKSCDSPPFYFLNTEWCLRILIMEFEGNRYFKCLYLVVKNPSSRYCVTFTLGIRHLRVPFQFGPEAKIFDKKTTYHGSAEMMESHRFERSDPNDDSLVIYCDAGQSKLSEATACQTTLFNSTTNLCRDFQELLLSGRKSDLTIAVRGQEFKAHKLILETRSSVFAAMIEKKENSIEVEDCDPDTFQNFLQCIYSGMVETLSVDKAIRLYMVSHKYTVTDIMETCVKLIGEEMSEDTVCDILAFANRYNKKNLQKTAEEFLIRNIRGIISTKNWGSLMAENSLLEKYS